MLLVLSPSKTQDFETPSRAPAFKQPEFLNEIQDLTKILKGFSATQIAELMGVSEKIANLNAKRFKNFNPTFTKQNSKPAIEAFQGDVYRDIDTVNYTDEDFEFANEHIRIISGLYGILKPLDLIQPYRLEMKTKLKNAKGKNLYEFWGQKLAHVMNKECTTIVNLASNEYFDALKKHLTCPVQKITFKENKSGEYKIIAIYSKLARGTMANWIVKNRINDPLALKGFNLDNYQFNKSESKESEYVFTRG
jgi:hypothetical protein